jgi:glycosyltransferase involved in cell wall biosynthesis
VKVAHLTSVHPRYDTRIFLKECSSLVRNGHDVSLVVADSKGDEEKAGVKIFDVGATSSRWQRILRVPDKIYQRALGLNADIYHLHDPELLPIGLKLKKSGKCVTFDAHEDFPKQLLSKPYLNTAIRKPVSKLAAWYENYVCKRLDAIVTATPYIRNKFQSINKRVIDVNNFPIIGELISEKNKEKTLNSVCYIGGMAEIRGLKEMVSAMAYAKPDITLILAGRLENGILKKTLCEMSAWPKVSAVGFLDRKQIKEVYQKSFAGLVVLHPIVNYLDALPVKMFEYMSAGLPVIASNFPLWEAIIDKESCGICVDPLNPKEIAAAINYLYDNPDIARQMGRNGQKAVIEKYNWQQEEQKLMQLYQELI